MRQLRRTLPILCAVLAITACNRSQTPPAPDDNAIKTAIQSKLYQDATLRTRNVQVDSQQGVVTLTGTVNSDAEKSLAEQYAQVPGVKQVVDQLSVMPPDRSQAPPPAAGTQGETRQAGSMAGTAAERRTSTTATIPAGHVITVRMIDGIDSSVNRAGQTFAASVAAPVAVGNRLVIPEGADARVRLVSASSSGKFRGRAELQLELVSITVHGKTYEVRSGDYQARGASRGKRSAVAIGGGAAVGGIIGALAGGRKGAAIGAGVGAGAGTGYQVLSKGSNVKIPSETKIDFKLAAPLTVAVGL